jgi:drug/metabolite transporter (DMT)-like permease
VTGHAPRGRRWPTHAALILVQIAFASGAVEGKIAMMPRAAGGEGIAPTAVAMARMLGACAFFQVFARSTRRLAPTAPRDHVSLALFGVLGIALNQALFLIGLVLTTPTIAALLSITIPVLTAALAIALRQEPASRRTGVGIALAGAGGAWLVTGGGGRASLDIGALLIALNSLSYSLYIVLSRRTIQRLGAMTVITWMFTWAVVAFAPFGLAPLIASVPEWTPRGWTYIAYIVVVPTVVAYLANAWALGRSSPTLVTIYIYVQPAIAAVLAWMQLGQGLSSRLVASAALILVGVTVVATRRPPMPALRSAR